jgi:hypothetical protein
LDGWCAACQTQSQAVPSETRGDDAC